MEDETCCVKDAYISYDGDVYWWCLDPFEDLPIEYDAILDIDNMRKIDKIKFLFKEKLHPIKVIRKILYRIRSNTFEGG